MAMRNPFEGQPICFQGPSAVANYQAIIYGSKEEWEKRHPGRQWELDRWGYPDAIQAISTEHWGPEGPIVPRVKAKDEVTDDDVAEALADWPWPYDPREVLAKDVSLYDIFPDDDPDD